MSRLRRSSTTITPKSAMKTLIRKVGRAVRLEVISGMGGDERQSVAISGNQRQSVAIRGNQYHAKATWVSVRSII